ncbi:MAG: hypothetical protein NTV21_00285 [Planctomycetota bacterium]|nr:hypothetical protein [Planctomycetota bacterium]
MAELAEPAPASNESLVSRLCATHLQPRPEIARLIERAREDLDAPTAQTWALGLLEVLSANPEDELALEALLVLGLAHPDVHQRHRIGMPQEGRRLAVLLERSGDAVRAEHLLDLLIEQNRGDAALQADLAALVRRSGSLGRKVERHLRAAEEAVQQGNRAEAVRWLREVLALDPRRRDVARMIRDLRFEESQVREGWVRRSRLALIACAAVAVLAVVVGRERQISEELGALPEARPGDLLSTQERLAALQEVFDANVAWVTMWSAGQERAALKAEAERLAAAEADARAKLADARARARILADAEFAQARLSADRLEFDEAREHFEKALRLAPQGWESRGQVEREVALLQQWKRDGTTVSKEGVR